MARQPILTGDEKVFGYELLFRDGVDDYFRNPDPDVASRSTLSTSMLMGLDVLCDGRRAFINVTRDVLLKDYITSAAFVANRGGDSGKRSAGRRGHGGLPAAEGSRVFDRAR